MKNLVLFLSLLPLAGIAQQPDSIDIVRKGNIVRIAQPQAGRESVVILNDSIDSLQIKISNLRTLNPVAPIPATPRKTVKYLSELSLGTVLANELPISESMSLGPKYAIDYFTFSEQKIQPGIEFGISLRKVERRISKHLSLLSGLDYRLMYIRMDSRYEAYEFYHYDSVQPLIADAKVREHESRELRVNNFVNQLSFPLLLDVKFQRNISIGIGAAFDLSINSRHFNDPEGQLNPMIYYWKEFAEPFYPVFQIRPQIRARIGRISAYLTNDIYKTEISGGYTDSRYVRYLRAGLTYMFF